MTFMRSILILLIAIVATGVPYAFGHALSNHSMTPVIVGAVCLVLAVGLGFVLTRGRRERV